MPKLTLKSKGLMAAARQIPLPELRPITSAVDAAAQDVEDIYKEFSEFKEAFDRFFTLEKKYLTINAGESTISIHPDEIILKTGSAIVQMKKDGSISLRGDDIRIVGAGRVDVKANGDLTLKGSKIRDN